MPGESIGGRRVCVRCGAMFRGEVGHCSRDGAALRTGTADPLLGRRLRNGRYVVRRFIGEGSAGRVYEAEILETGRPCAVKVLFGELAAMPDILSRFRREAEVAGKLGHRNIAEVIDSGFDEPTEPLFIVMALVPGPTLLQFVEARGPFGERHARRVLRGVASGLAHAHERGVLHRDLKPDNIILSPPKGEPRLVDFGVSKLFLTHAHPNLTSYGRVVGTPGFIAPEVLQGKTADSRADLYGLGVTAFFVVTGKLPFSEENDRPFSDTLAGVSTDALDKTTLSPELRECIRQLVAVDPEDRPANAMEVVDALRGGAAAARRRPKLKLPLSSGAASKDSWRRPALAVVLLAVALAALVWGTGAETSPAAQTPSPESKATIDAVQLDRGHGHEDLRTTTPLRVRDEAVAKALREPKALDGGPAKPAPPVRRRRRRSRSSRPDAVRTTDREGWVQPERQERGDATARTREAPSERLKREYAELGVRLQRLPQRQNLAGLRGRYLDLPIADALRRPETVAGVLQRLERLSADVAVQEAQGTSPLRP